MNIKQVLLQGTLAMVVAVALAGCNDDSKATADANTNDAMSQTQSQVDQTMDDVNKTLDKAGQKLQEKANDVGNAIEDTCEKAKESMDAKDTNC